MCEYIKINGDEIPKHHPKVFICTSAVGYYPCSDASSPNYDVEVFLSLLTKKIFIK